MFLLRILFNALIVAVEIGAAAVVAAAGYRYPLAFAAATAVIALILGSRLEQVRFVNEIPVFFGRPITGTKLFIRLAALFEAAFRALLAGVAALLTFAGTDKGRLYWVAILFAVCTWAGANILRWLSIRLEARTGAWGYFRLAAPLGLLFSAGITLLTALAFIRAPSLREIGTAVVDMPARPRIEQVSELLFLAKQYFDEIVLTLLTTVLEPRMARVVALFISANVLSGFVVALYAALIAMLIGRMERGRTGG